MARKSTPIVEHAWTNEERSKFQHAKEVITECQLKAEGIAERIAGQLYIVNKLELYRIDDYTSMGEWASERFDISKGTCSDAINTYDRFGDKDHLGVIADKYSEYMFSSLMAMKKLSDLQIQQAGIHPGMSRTAIKDAMKALKELEDKEAQRPALWKQLQNLVKAWHALSPDKNSIIEKIKAVCPDFFSKDKQPTIAEIESAIELASKEIDKLNNEQEAQEQEAQEQEAQEPEAQEPEAQEPEAQESVEPDTEVTGMGGNLREAAAIEQEFQEQEQEAQEDEGTEITFNINAYKDANGNLRKKALLDDIWKKIITLEGNDYIVIEQ